MKLHERLRELRKTRNLRLRDVSPRAGISIPYLSDLERGRTNPSLDTLQTLAKAYEISLQDLLFGVDFYGEAGEGALPSGLAELEEQLKADLPVERHGEAADWVKTLSRIEFRGQRPQTKDDWNEIYLHLRRIIN